MLHRGACRLCRLRDFGERASYAATSRITQYVDVDPVSKNCSHESVQRRTVAGDLVSNSNPSRTDMIAMPCTAIGPLTMILSFRCACRMDVYVFRNDADAGSVYENLVCFTPVNHLCITSDELDTCGIGSRVHRLDDAPEIFHRQTFFQDEPGREIKRPCSAHREIVHRSVNGEFSDIASGKKIGLTTNESVLNATRSPFNEKIAPSWSGSSSSLRNYGNIIFWINWWLSFPPLP